MSNLTIIIFDVKKDVGNQDQPLILQLKKPRSIIWDSSTTGVRINVCQIHDPMHSRKCLQINSGIRLHPRPVPVSFHHINEVICCGVTTQSHIGIMNFVFRQNALHSFCIQFTLRALNGHTRHWLVGEQKSPKSIYWCIQIILANMRTKFLKTIILDKSNCLLVGNTFKKSFQPLRKVLRASTVSLPNCVHPPTQIHMLKS